MQHYPLLIITFVATINVEIMSLVSVKDFGIALKISGGTIRSRISRKKLRCNKKGLIDTENPTNYIYLLEVNGGDQSVFEQYHQGVLSKPKVVKINPTPKENTTKIDLGKEKLVLEDESGVIPEKEEKQKPSKIRGSVKVVPTVETKIITEKKDIQKFSVEDKREQEAQRKARMSFLDMEVQRKQAELLVIQHNAELKQYELDKKAGNTLPLNMIDKVVGINYKAVFKAVHSQLKNIAMVMVQQLGGSKEDLNSILIDMENLLDKAVKDSKKKAEVDIDKLIEEYSEVRSRGERKI